MERAKFLALYSMAAEMHDGWCDGTWQPQDGWAAIVAEILRAAGIEVEYKDPAEWPPS